MAGHLGYLLKRVQLRFSELAAAELAPTGINGREAAVLRAVDNPQPLAQGEIARRDPGDRRRNVVELTDAGQDITRQAARTGEQAERTFLSPLSVGEAQQFKKTLRALLYNPPAGPR
jgi:hypothetical protein